MPAGINFIQLEGNYVVSFRDTSECLPAFTAVRLDRRRRSSIDSSGGGGSSSQNSPRRKRSAQSSGPKLVITGIPARIRTDLIKTKLEDFIPGIVSVYRDPDMARELAKPPVFVETRLSIALDAFMLRAEWIPEIQRLVKNGDTLSMPTITVDESEEQVRFNLPPNHRDEKAPDSEKETKAQRRKSLVALSVTCPHGKYLAQETCSLCRHQERRYSFVADTVVTHPETENSAGKRKNSCPGMCILSVFRRRPLQFDTPVSPVHEEPPPVFLDPKLLARVKEQRRHSAYDIPVHDA